MDAVFLCRNPQKNTEKIKIRYIGKRSGEVECGEEIEEESERLRFALKDWAAGVCWPKSAGRPSREEGYWPAEGCVACTKRRCMTKGYR